MRARRNLITAVALVLCAAAAAQAQTSPTPPPASPPASAAGPPTWKLIYQNSQKAYYVGLGNSRPDGQSNVESLLEFKIPQVIDGAQVWSIVSRMKLNCEQKQIITIDNTLYALQMGAGPVVQSQSVSDSWHTPQPESLGGLVWSAACATP